MNKMPADIQDLIGKYQEGTATPGEISRLNEWYHSFDDSELEIPADLTGSVQELSGRMRSRLLETINNNKPPNSVTRQLRRKWFIPAAAAIVLMLGGTYYFFVPRSGAKKQKAKIANTTPALPNDLAPGGNKALLTLADGSTVTLDSLSNGLICKQGNIRINKSANGILLYTPVVKTVAGRDEILFNTITTPRGGQFQVVLSDGTKVWLNAASSISFPVLFTGGERKVKITGETYFEVAHNAAMPFRVKAFNSETEVIGTHFNINAYDDEGAIKTTLLEGKIKISVSSDGNRISRLLLPNQQSSINKSGMINVVEKADAQETVAWKNGQFQFKSADLKTILRQIARWYDVDVEYKGDIDLHFTGQLTRNENVSRVFEKLALTGEIHYRVEGRKMIVSR